LKLDLTGEQRKRAIASIKQFATQELDLDPGDLKAGIILDFFLQELGPSVYNRAIQDAQTYMRDRTADLEAVCYADEFAYWRK
jgi:uncharacterized protein (DUF2164 family)